MPPCAHAVDPPEMPPLASTATLSSGAMLSAALSPAAPEPMMTTSNSVLAIGVRGAGEAQEHILEIGFASGDVDNA
jgi:hypothetical protein